MNFSKRTNLISFLSVGALVLILALYPHPEGIIYQSIRGMVLVGILWLILLINFQRHEKTDGSDDSDGSDQINLEEKAFLNELKTHFKELIDSVFRAVRSIHPDYQAGIYMVDPESKGFTLQESTSAGFNKFITGHNEIINSILNSSDVLLLQEKDIREGWDTVFPPQTWRGSECLMGVRILYKNTPIGCIIATIDHFSKIQDRDRDLLKNMGNFFSMGMSKIEKIEQLLSDNFYHSRIASLFDVLEITSNETDLFENVQRMCRSFFDYDKLTIATVDPFENKLIIRMVDGFTADFESEQSIDPKGTLPGEILKQGKSIISEHRSKDFPQLTRFGKSEVNDEPFQSLLGVPITGRREIVGVILLERQNTKAFTLSDRHLMELMGTTVGSILSWIEEYEKMRRSSIHDGLTGLLNHTALMDRFNDEINRSVRFNHKLVTIVFDLDKFKRVNDTYGHLFGDKVLKTVSNIMKSSVRNIDVVARYGGEEFVIILVNTTVDVSLPVAERIINKIAEFPFNKDGESVQVTISAGVAEFPKQSDKIKDLIECADQAMYKSKEKGGNQVTVYSKIDME